MNSKIEELISECRSYLNRIITKQTSKSEKIDYGWKALEKLRLIEMEIKGSKQ
jgi:hypothetical protein